MTSQQREAHLRMISFLPVKTHAAVLRQEQSNPAVVREIKSVEVGGVIYKSRSQAIKAIGVSKWELNLMIESGDARLVDEPDEQET